MILTTTDISKAKDVKGLVFGEVVLGNSAGRDLKASLKAMTGGRAKGYEEGMKQAREDAIKEMVAEAEALGANAVMGVSVDYELIGEGSMMVASASGTAVTL